MSATGYYDIMNKIEEILNGIPMVNTVTYGEVDETSFRKTTIFPLAHFFVNGIQPTKTLNINISVILAGRPNIQKTEDRDIIKNDDLYDVMNTNLAIGLRLLEKLARGDVRDDAYHLVEGSADFEPFEERFTDALAGWVLTFDVIIPNTMNQN